MKKARELHPLKTSKELWQEISIDIIGYSRLIYKDDLTQSNNNDNFIRRNCKNILRQNMEDIWSTTKNP